MASLRKDLEKFEKENTQLMQVLWNLEKEKEELTDELRELNTHLNQPDGFRLQTTEDGRKQRVVDLHTQETKIARLREDYEKCLKELLKKEVESNEQKYKIRKKHRLLQQLEKIKDENARRRNENSKLRQEHKQMMLDLSFLEIKNKEAERVLKAEEEALKQKL